MSEPITNYRELGSLVRPVDTKLTFRKDPSKPYVGLEHLPSRGAYLLGWEAASHSISTNSMFSAGDVLFGKLRPNLRKCVSAPLDGYCSTDILVLRAREDIHAGFAARVFQSERVGAAAERTAIGTKMPRTSWTHLSGLEVFCPSFPEQERIAHIFDTLDIAIQQTEAIIAKLKAAKHGLLHDLLTRGIGANGELRPPHHDAPDLYQRAGDKWMPREWTVAPVDSFGSVMLGRQRSPDKHTGRWPMPYLRVANVFDGFINYSDVLEMDFTLSERQIYDLRPGDILLNEGQSLELVGRSALFDGEAGRYCFQNTLIRFRVYPENSAPFFRHLFKWYLDTGVFAQIAKQTTSVAHLGADRFATMACVGVPPMEQDAIAARLDEMQRVIVGEQQRLEKMKRQRSGLSDDLLSGRIRVTAPLAATEQLKLADVA